MNREFVPARLDVNAFATDAAELAGHEPAARFERLSAELAEPAPEAQVAWQASGEQRAGADGSPAAWLHLSADVVLPFVCQRCLTTVQLALNVERSFRFVADEEIAAFEDEASDEDVLVAARDFDLLGLIEDELLMEVPVTPRHDVCPVDVRLTAADPGFEEAEGPDANPFSVLQSLRGRKAD